MSADTRAAIPTGMERPVDEDGKMTVTVRVNGRTRRVKARTHHTLLEVLRNQLKLFGVREGCGVGMCGACTVLLDGKPVSSCLLLAPLAEGKDILTVEGLEGPNGELDAIQQAYVDHTAFQCSYCTPGFILSTRALLAEKPRASEEEIREYLSGNLCRCGSYVKIMDAVRDARDRLSGATQARATSGRTADTHGAAQAPATSGRTADTHE